MSHKAARIAHIVGKLAAGGVEAAVFNYCKYIDHDKYQFDIYYDDDSTVEPPKELIDIGIRFIKIPRYQRLNAYLKTLIKLFQEERYQMVHSHMNTLSVFPLFAAWIAGVPIRIAHNHSITVKGEGIRTLMKSSLRLVSKVFATDYAACSLAAAESLFGQKMVDANKVVIINNAIETANFAFDKELREKMRNELGVKNELLIGHVGRFTYAKNHLFIVDVFSCLRKNQEAKLLFVGDGSLMQETKSYIDSLGLTEKVIFVGAQANTAHYYQAMDLFLFPSIFEGLGMAAIEAQTSGLPVVMSTAVPAEAALTNECLRLPLSDSAERWAENSNKLLQQRKDSKRSLGAGTVAAHGYEISIAAKELEKYYSVLFNRLQH